MKPILLLLPATLCLSCKEEAKPTGKPPAEASSPETPPAQTSQKPKTPPRDLFFTISLEGGPLDGKSYTGKVTGMPSGVSADTHQGNSSVAFTKVTLPDSSYTANFGVTWQGDLSDGTKTQHFDGNGSAETGKSGHLNLFSSDPNAEFSRLQIQFKDTSLKITDTSSWEDTSSKVYQQKFFNGEGEVAKTLTKFYQGNRMVSDATSEEITLKFSFSAKASHLK